MLNRISAFTAMTALLVASCADDHVMDPQTSDSDYQIRVSTLSQDQFTRVSESNIDSLQRNGVRVFCCVAGELDTTNYFTDYVKYDGTAWNFQSSKPHLWPEPNAATNEVDTLLNFYAVSPSNLEVYSATGFSNNTEIATLIFWNIPDTCDILYSPLINQTYRSNNRAIAMTFQHIMTEVEVGVSLRSQLTNEYDSYRLEVNFIGRISTSFNLKDTCWLYSGIHEGWEREETYKYAIPNNGLSPLDTNVESPTYQSIGAMKFIIPAKYDIAVLCYGNILKDGELFHEELVNTLTGTIDLSNYMGKKVTVHLSATMTGDGNRPLDSLETDNDDPVGTIDAPQIRVSEWE